MDLAQWNIRSFLVLRCPRGQTSGTTDICTPPPRSLANLIGTLVLSKHYVMPHSKGGMGEEERRGGRKRGEGRIEREGGHERGEEGGLAHLLPSKDVLVEVKLQLFIGNVDTQLLK